MGPDPVDQQSVSHGNVNRDGSHPTRDPLDGGDDFLTEPVEEERIADLDKDALVWPRFTASHGCG